MELQFKHIIDSSRATQDPTWQAQKIADWLEQHSDYFIGFQLAPSDVRNTTMYFQLSSQLKSIEAFVLSKGDKLV